MRQFDDKWKAYCGWCRRVVAIRQYKEEADKELLEHYLFMHPHKQPFFDPKEEIIKE